MPGQMGCCDAFITLYCSDFDTLDIVCGFFFACFAFDPHARIGRIDGMCMHENFLTGNL